MWVKGRHLVDHQFKIDDIMFLLRAVLNILVRNTSPRGPIIFRLLIVRLSGPCELLFFTSWTREVVSVMLYLVCFVLLC